jgi:hypothetical protein
MRITRSSLRNLVSVLNRRLNRPETDWTRIDGRPYANVGHFGVSIWSPGDGWSRYQVYELLENGGQNTIGPCGTASEVFYYLRGVLDSLDCRYTEFPEVKS